MRTGHCECSHVLLTSEMKTVDGSLKVERPIQAVVISTPGTGVTYLLMEFSEVRSVDGSYSLP